ncbi:MAG: polysaccharide biosynthesis C-terminal domain-containing protein [Chlorobium sp.]|nr:polysaccharide biosynthesis C-terminal domain-containing protein [Chlorobium sp.]
MSVVGYMGLLDLGVGPALLRYVAVAHGREDRHQMQQIISSAFVFFIIIGAVAVGGLVTLSFFPSLLVWREQVNTEYLVTVILLFAANAALLFPLNVLTAILMGVQRHSLINFTRGLSGIIRAFIAYYLLVTFPSKGLIVLAMLESIFNLIQLVIFSFALRYDQAIPSFSFSACSFATMKELFGYGGKSATLMIASRVQNASLPFVISAMLGVSNIVYFTLPSRLIDYAKGLSLAMGFPLTPYFAAQMIGEDGSTIKASWLQTSLALMIITTAMSLVIFFCGEHFLSIWIGKEYSLAGRGVLYCLVIALFVESVSPNASRILMASGHHGKAAFVWLVLAIMSIPLAILGASKWGVTGVSFGASAAIIVGNLVMLRMACHDVGVSVSEYLRQTLVRLVVPLFILASILYITGFFFLPSNYLRLVLQVSSSLFIYLVAVWFLTLKAENRMRISNRVQLFFKGFAN